MQQTTAHTVFIRQDKNRRMEKRRDSGTIVCETLGNGLMSDGTYDSSFQVICLRKVRKYLGGKSKVYARLSYFETYTSN